MPSQDTQRSQVRMPNGSTLKRPAYFAYLLGSLGMLEVLPTGKRKMVGQPGVFTISGACNHFTVAIYHL